MIIKMIGRAVILEDGNNIFEISQSLDNDIRFSCLEPNMEFRLNFDSRIIAEWKSYEIFMSLMKEMIGDYVLEESSKRQYLPEDFIDLENKTIIWHSDNGTDNILKLQYCDNSIIVSMIKDINASKHVNNNIGIRTSGSNYGYYYKYFLKFYKELLELLYVINPIKVEVQKDTHNTQVLEAPKVLETYELQKKKKFSLFNRNNQK